MGKQLTSEKEVLERIGAPDFRSISKTQLLKFVSALPDMDKETAIKCIEQFPNFKEYATGIISELRNFLEKVSEQNKNIQKEAIAAHRQIINALMLELKQDDLSESRRTELIELMRDEAIKIDELAREHQLFNKHITTIFGVIASAAIFIGGAMLGVKTLKSQ